MTRLLTTNFHFRYWTGTDDFVIGYACNDGDTGPPTNY